MHFLDNCLDFGSLLGSMSSPFSFILASLFESKGDMFKVILFDLFLDHFLNDSLMTLNFYLRRLVNILLYV